MVHNNPSSQVFHGLDRINYFHFSTKLTEYEADSLTVKHSTKVPNQNLILSELSSPQCSTDNMNSVCFSNYSLLQNHADLSKFEYSCVRVKHVPAFLGCGFCYECRFCVESTSNKEENVRLLMFGFIISTKSVCTVLCD